MIQTKPQSADLPAFDRNFWDGTFRFTRIGTGSQQDQNLTSKMHSGIVVGEPCSRHRNLAIPTATRTAIR